jgi:hypothetical protein
MPPSHPCRPATPAGGQAAAAAAAGSATARARSPPRPREQSEVICKNWRGPERDNMGPAPRGES